MRFLARAYPSKLENTGADGAFRTFLGSLPKNGYLKIINKTKAGPFGSAGGRIPERRGVAPLHDFAPKSAGATTINSNPLIQKFFLS